MKASVLRIHWHDKKPVFSCDIDPSNPKRLVTCGGDNNIRIWHLTHKDAQCADVELVKYNTTLSRHIRAVNCVRFSHNGSMLASVSDGGTMIIWRQSDGKIKENKSIFGSAVDEFEDEVGVGGVEEGCLDNENDVDREYWSPVHTIRAAEGEDIYDLAWSPNDEHVIIGLTDNSAQIWNVSSSGCKLVRQLKDHHHFVQGVCWDPLGRFVLTQSADRSVRGWQGRWNAVKGGGNTSHSLQFTCAFKLARSAQLFHDETLVTFFRRLTFTPDGSLVFIPAGLCSGEDSSSLQNCLYIMSRAAIANTSTTLPTAKITGFEKAVLGVRCHSRLFKLRQTSTSTSTSSPFNLPYSIVFAVFTMDTVAIFSTEQLSHPIATFQDLHYGSITDIVWKKDDYSFIVTATDGFCSHCEFEEGELGQFIDFSDQPKIIEEKCHFYGLDSPTNNKENISLVSCNTPQKPIAPVNVISSSLIKRKPIS